MVTSCFNKLLEHVDYWSLNDGNEVEVIDLQYNKAFDKVNHRILQARNLQREHIQVKLGYMPYEQQFSYIGWNFEIGTGDSALH